MDLHSSQVTLIWWWWWSLYNHILLLRFLRVLNAIGLLLLETKRRRAKSRHSEWKLHPRLHDACQWWRPTNKQRGFCKAFHLEKTKTLHGNRAWNVTGRSWAINLQHFMVRYYLVQINWSFTRGFAHGHLLFWVSPPLESVALLAILTHPGRGGGGLPKGVIGWICTSDFWGRGSNLKKSDFFRGALTSRSDSWDVPWFITTKQKCQVQESPRIVILTDTGTIVYTDQCPKNMRSQNWWFGWFGDPRPLLHTSKILYIGGSNDS